MKIDKHLLFLKPFIEASSSLVDLKRIKAIKAYRVPSHLCERSYASILREGNNKTFTININLWKHVLKGTGKKKYVEKHKRQYLAFILDSLAHELAHVKYWGHPYGHFQLQVKIMAKFGKILRKMNIQDTYILLPKGEK